MEEPERTRRHQDSEVMDIARLDATVNELRSRATAFAACGTGGYVVQVHADWRDYPAWIDHVHYDDHVGVPLTFATREDAQRYIDASVEHDYAKERARWSARHAAWLPRHEKYMQRCALLEEHGLWTDAADTLAPLVFPAGPGREPVRKPDTWRVVAYSDSNLYDPGDHDSAQVRWCATCKGRVVIDIDCDDPTHEHRWVPYRRRSGIATAQ